MNAWNPVAVRAFTPALVGWCLALAACLRAEQLHGDLHAQVLLPVLQDLRGRAAGVYAVLHRCRQHRAVAVGQERGGVMRWMVTASFVTCCVSAGLHPN